MANRPTPSDFDDPAASRVLSVSQLTAEIKGVLEGSFPHVWVSGEISNFSRPQSGHCYLTLKDDQAQLRAVVWRTLASRLRFELEDGMEVICRGGLDLYPPRGSYQLVIEEIQPKGIGALELALRKLRERLAAEGLFDSERKRPLPRFPRRIAFVTSPTGAAIRDFLEVLRRRWSAAHVLVVPTRVQGEGAAQEIAAAIELANRVRPSIDVLVVGRGGGSLEDLWAFNEEPVVRAIHESRIPVVSAVGHEIDVTLADLVADVRALTPSEAAERVVPHIAEIQELLHRQGKRLGAALAGRAAGARLRLDAIAARRSLTRPLERTRLLAQRLDELGARGARAAAQRLMSTRAAIEIKAAQLESLSPIGVLSRGYSVTRRAEEGTVIRSASEVASGDRLLTRFADGQITSVAE